MKTEVTKNNLVSGDIVVTRNGKLGVVLVEREYILYQNDGVDFLDLFTEDLLSVDEDRNWDIIKVYRGAVIGFYDYEDYEPIFEREDDNVITDEKCDVQVPIQMEKRVEERSDSSNILVMVQAFYGNRTEIDIPVRELDKLIYGFSGDSLMEKNDIDRSIVRIPNTNNCVLIYNKYQEEQKLMQKEQLLQEENYALKPVANIPEENVQIFSRCVVCRMKENGDFESLQIEDKDRILKYLSK